MVLLVTENLLALLSLHSLQNFVRRNRLCAVVAAAVVLLQVSSVWVVNIAKDADFRRCRLLLCGVSGLRTIAFELRKFPPSLLDKQRCDRPCPTKKQDHPVTSRMAVEVQRAIQSRFLTSPCVQECFGAGWSPVKWLLSIVIARHRRQFFWEAHSLKIATETLRSPLSSLDVLERNCYSGLLPWPTRVYGTNERLKSRIGCQQCS